MEVRAAHHVEDHSATLRRAFDDGVAAHGALPLVFDAFSARALALTVRRLQRSTPSPTRDDVAAVLARAALADVYLAVACEDGVPGAWDRFVAEYGPAIVGLAIRRGASRGDAEELARELPGELFTPPPGGGARTRLGTFDGAGSLLGWLGVIVDRRLADRWRTASRAGATSSTEDASLPERGAAGDPVTAALSAEARTRCEDAMREAWESLTAREALALLLRYRHGLRQTQIARMLDVGEPRASRVLAAAAAKVRATVLLRLGAQPGEGQRDAGPVWAALERGVAEFLATLPPPSDPLAHG